MFESVYKYMQDVFTSAVVYILQTTFVQSLIHLHRYYNQTLYIGDYSENEFDNTWTTVCVKKCNPNSIYYYIIDPTTPLRLIDTDIVYTLKNPVGDVRYFPVFAREIADMIEWHNVDDVITLYDVLRWRINNQISDFSPIDEKYENLFDEDDQYFIPYMEDNNFMDSLDHMYKVKAIF